MTRLRGTLKVGIEPHPIATEVLSVIDMHPISLPFPVELETDALPHEGEQLDEDAAAEAIDIQIADALFTA